MSGIEVPAFLIGVAGLFSSCIDAFSYFKLAQRASKEVEVVLLRMDIEKARLLIWSENVGIFSANHRDRPWLDKRTAELVQRILSQIESLLTNSEQLRTSYGARTLDTPLDRAVDYVSSKSLAVFRRSANRFWVRHASELSTEFKRSKLLSTKWAIYEREKFQGLVNNLSDFVDKLFELSKVAREVQDRAIIEDIESILDISHLTIIEEATEESYRIYSQAASSARASTEAGTIDRRTVEEHLRDVEGMEKLDLHPDLQTSNVTDLDTFWLEVSQCLDSVVLTSKCRKLQTKHPCDVRLLGHQTATKHLGTPPWDISSKNWHGGQALWQLIRRLIDVRSQIMMIEDGVLGAILKETNGEQLNPMQNGFRNSRLPLITLFIYCSPCVSLLHTAMSICLCLSTPYVWVWIRPDDRLISSCCTTVDRTLGLRSMLEWDREWMSTATRDEISLLASHLDTVWLDQRLDHLDYERPYVYQEASSTSSHVIVIGEADYLMPLVQKAPGRMPCAMDIWQFERSVSVPTRRFFGRFVESKYTGSQERVAPRPQPRETLKARKPSSPISSDSKRQKLENGTTAGSVDESSEDEDSSHQVSEGPE